MYLFPNLGPTQSSETLPQLDQSDRWPGYLIFNLTVRESVSGVLLCWTVLHCNTYSSLCFTNISLKCTVPHYWTALYCNLFHCTALLMSMRGPVITPISHLSRDTETGHSCYCSKYSSSFNRKKSHCCSCWFQHIYFPATWSNRIITI